MTTKNKPVMRDKIIELRTELGKYHKSVETLININTALKKELVRLKKEKDKWEVEATLRIDCEEKFREKVEEIKKRIDQIRTSTYNFKSLDIIKGIIDEVFGLDKKV